MYMVTNFNWYFLMYYLPKSLKSQFPEMNGSNEGKILLALLGGRSAIDRHGGLFAGRRVQRLLHQKNRRPQMGSTVVRDGRIWRSGSLFTSPLSLFAGGSSIWPFAICLILVGFTNDFIMGPSWATAQDIGGRYSAIVSGTMNMIGNLGATLGNLTTGLILKAYTDADTKDVSTEGYQICFLMYACFYGLGVGSWLFIDPTKPIEPHSKKRA